MDNLLIEYKNNTDQAFLSQFPWSEYISQPQA